VTSPSSPHPSTSTPAVKVACSFCGQENDSNAGFCADCGKPLRASGAGSVASVSATTGPMPGAMPATKCRKCHQMVPGEHTFCGFCGTKTTSKVEEGSCRNCGAKYVRGSDLFCASCGTRVGDRVSVVKPTSAIIGGRGSTPSISILDERGEPSRTFIKFEFDVYLSPLHARIDLNDGTLWLRDLGSRNGSWVFIDEPTKLIDGDLIMIGSQLLRFRRLGYPGPHPPEADSTRRMGSVTPPVDVAIIEQLRADGSVRDVFHLSPGRNCLLGREVGDWIFPYDQTMSGKHAEVVSEDIEFYVQDAGSRNGVAMAVRGDRELKKNQRFLLGDQILRVEST
jgi:pSer/pThr/pTyr-binding forkhead associated (FHA) protein